MLEREHTGRGQPDIPAGLTRWCQRLPGRQGYRCRRGPRSARKHHPSIAPDGVFRCRGGSVQISVGSEKLWKAFAPASGIGAPGGGPWHQTSRGTARFRGAAGSGAVGAGGLLRRAGCGRGEGLQRRVNLHGRGPDTGRGCRRDFLAMVEIVAAIQTHRSAGLPYLVYLRHPTTGGVMASRGSLGHVAAGEPGALLGWLVRSRYRFAHPPSHPRPPWPEGQKQQAERSSCGRVRSVSNDHFRAHRNADNRPSVKHGRPGIGGSSASKGCVWYFRGGGVPAATSATAGGP